MQGKTIPFILGCIVGVAGLFAVNSARMTQAPDTVQPISQAPEALASPAPVKSPLAVVAEPEPVVLPTDTSEQDQQRFEALESRLAETEERIESLEIALANGSVSDPEGIDLTQLEPSEPDLVAAGFDPFTVDTIKNARDQVQLERLELRDRATREGWIDSDQFRQSFRNLRDSNRIRETLGDEEYDRLLIAEGRDNRIGIDSVIASSAAAGAGIQEGDTIYRYADDRIFTFRDLREASTSGDRNEPVTIQVIRNGTLIDLVIPRGPLGVTISAFTDEEN